MGHCKIPNFLQFYELPTLPTQRTYITQNLAGAQHVRQKTHVGIVDSLDYVKIVCRALIWYEGVTLTI